LHCSVAIHARCYIANRLYTIVERQMSTRDRIKPFRGHRPHAAHAVHLAQQRHRMVEHLAA
jgi:hypothetical protein